MSNFTVFLDFLVQVTINISFYRCIMLNGIESSAAATALVMFFATIAATMSIQSVFSARGKKTGLQYVSFSEVLLKKDVLVVDCTHPTCRQLTHHLKLKGQREAHLGRDLGADSTTEQVLLAAKHTRFLNPGYEFSFVSTNHFDVDSFLSVWTACNPEKALQHEEVLQQAARIGDFRELCMKDKEGKPNEVSFKALALVCWLNSEERRLFYKPFEGSISKMNGEDGGDAKFDHFLPLFGQVLEDPMKALFQEQWTEEYSRVVAECNSLHGTAGTIETLPNIGLAVVSNPDPMHYYSLFSASIGLDIILAMYSNNRYELEIKYSTFIDLVSRPSLPRIELETLAKYLNSLEKESSLSWFANRVTDSGPMLRLESSKHLSKADRYAHPYERIIFPSSISPQEMKRIVISYFTHAYGSGSRECVLKKDWTWAEYHAYNKDVKWEEWRV